jgi:hypothetical protein
MKGKMQLSKAYLSTRQLATLYCARIIYRHINQVETGRKEGILARDSRLEDNEGKGEMVVNESRLG